MALSSGVNAAKHGVQTMKETISVAAGQISHMMDHSHNKFSTGQTPSKEIIELRTYSIYPDKMQEYLSLTKEEFHLRTAHSKLLGFWTSEFGGLNQTVHMWPYESLGKRAEVRVNLSKSQEWLSKYIAKVLPMLQTQDNALLRPLDHHFPPISKNSAAYELRLHHMATPPNVWMDPLEVFLKSDFINQLNSSHDTTSLIGAFETIAGPLNSVVFLWQHPTIDVTADLEDTLRKVHEYKSLSSNFSSTNSKIMYPFNVPMWN